MLLMPLSEKSFWIFGRSSTSEDVVLLLRPKRDPWASAEYQ